MTKDPNAPVTNKTLLEAVDTILEGMDRLFKEERSFNIKTFASKDDLSRETSWIRDDIKGLTADLSDTASRKEFNQFKSKVDKFISS